jgi:hypothetical protein
MNWKSEIKIFYFLFSMKFTFEGQTVPWIRVGLIPIFEEKQIQPKVGRPQFAFHESETKLQVIQFPILQTK